MITPRPFAAIVLALCAGFAAEPACARESGQSASSDPTREPLSTPSEDGVDLDRADAFSIRVDPAVWLPALRGDIGVGTSNTFDVETINADEIEPTPSGNFTIRSGDLVIDFNGFGVGISETERADRSFAVGGVAVPAGADVDFDLDITSFELTVGHRVWSGPGGVNDPELEVSRGSELDLWLDAYVGVRSYDIDAEFSAPVSTRGDIEDVHAIVGIALNMDLPRGFGMHLSADIGGGGDGTSGDITVAFDYEVADNAALLIGFRNLTTDIDGDGGRNDLEFDATLAGLFASLSIRF